MSAALPELFKGSENGSLGRYLQVPLPSYELLTAKIFSFAYCDNICHGFFTIINTGQGIVG